MSYDFAPGSVWVLESFWKLKSHFPGPGKFLKRKDFQNGYGKVLDFCLEKF